MKASTGKARADELRKGAVMREDGKLVFTVSAGHGEYMLAERQVIEGSLVTESIEDVTVEVLRGVIAEDLSDAGLPGATIDAGIVTIDGEDYDPQWEVFVRWFGPQETIERWLSELADEVMEGPEGGDDDTFDYWPSGVRYCLQVAEHVGNGWPANIAARAQAAIEDKRPEFKDELMAACGLEEEVGQ